MMRGKMFRCGMAALGAVFLLGGCAHKTPDGNTDGTEEAVSESSETVRIPASETNIETLYAERTADSALAAFLAEYYGIPEECCGETRYYYDLIDFNGDGADEILAVTVGEYTACDGGDPALILCQRDDGYEVVTAFDYVRTPVYISDTQTNGWYDLIFPAYGGDEGTGYRTFRFSADGGYKEALEEFADELPEDFSGRKILSDNFIDDLDKGTFLTLTGEP